MMIRGRVESLRAEMAHKKSTGNHLECRELRAVMDQSVLMQSDEELAVNLVFYYRDSTASSVSFQIPRIVRK
jgi:hypothetical protein